jgi:beta-lactamase regulating signal transducer with metallopeptidase domain
MTELSLLVLLKASVLLGLGLAAARPAVCAPASLRHLWLAATLAALAVLPVLTLAAPAVTIPVPAKYASFGLAPANHLRQGYGGQEGGSHESGREGSAGRTALASPIADASTGAGNRAISGVELASRILSLVWAAGALAVFASLIVSVARVSRIRRNGVPLPDIRTLAGTLAAEAGITRTVEVLEHEAIAAPFTCGLWRPAIVLPCDARTWDEADLRRAIVHELEHVRRHDWVVQLAARVVCAVYWFHPLVWTAWRGLCLEAERAADDAVLKSADRTDYADQLVLLARRLSNAQPRAILGMANRSDLSARVTALLDDRQRRGRAGGFAAAGALVAATLAVVGIAPVRAVAAAPQPPADQARIVGSARLELVSREPKSRRAGPIDRALFEAAQEGDIESIDKLLQAGADVNAAIDGDGSPLIGAARGGHFAAVKLLLDRGADPNLAVPGDGAPLLAAAQEGQTAVIALLLDRRANVDLIVPGDENALIQASVGGHLEVVKLLVARGANVNTRIWVDDSYPVRKGEWRTALNSARREGHDAVVAFLLAAGARE